MISQDADGWQIPVGLTASEAICIDDSDHSSDDGDFISHCDPHLSKTHVSVTTLSSIDTNRDMKSNVGEVVEEQRVDGYEAENALKKTKMVENRDGSDDNNPFACFAFEPAVAEQSNSQKRPNHDWLNAYKSSNQTMLPGSKRSKTQCITEPPEQFTPKCITKWHSFAVPTDSIELQRFHVLIAARLHAKCQEGTVKKAMDLLRGYFRESGGLTPETLSTTNPEDIAPLLSSVLFGKTKANQIVQAARDVLRLGGEVPELNKRLQMITGIGPKLAGILSAVNTKESYLSNEKG